MKKFWQLMASNDFDSVAQVLAPEYVLEWPQTGERIVGAERFARINREYPAQGAWRFRIHEIVSDGSRVVSDVEVTDGSVTARSIAFFWVVDGLIVRQVEFWPDPSPPHANRAHLVEPL